jgi:hypothetical protein
MRLSKYGLVALIMAGFLMLGLLSMPLLTCSATMSCPNGNVIFCETFGYCGPEASCIEYPNAGRVVCECGASYIIVYCDGSIIPGPKQPKG